MNKLLFIFLFFFSGFASSIEISSSEEIKFVDRKQNPQISIMKTDDFVGYIERIEEPDSDLRIIDYYQFDDAQKMKFNKKTCSKLLSRIFGPLNEITLKVKIEKYSERIIKSNPVCEAVALDPDKNSKIPERRALLTVRKGIPYALVFKLSKKSDPAALENARDFLKSLK